MQKVIDLKKKKLEDSAPQETRDSAAHALPEHAPAAPSQQTRLADPVGGPEKVSWSAPLYSSHVNHKALTVLAFILFASGSFFIFGDRSIVAAIFFFAAGIFVMYLPHRRNPVIDFQIGPMSVKFGEAEYKFRDIKSFWIEYQPSGIKEISLHLNKWYVPYVRIPLGEQNPLHVRDIMFQFVPEEEHHESFIETIGRLLGF